ncbi:hypothetical protein NMG60_11022136 [Bertholletia excelsa]
MAVLIISSFGGSSALQHKVGNSVWSIPPTKDFYANWSSSRSFLVGDSLVFEFDSELHNVMQVSRRDYDNCDAGHPLRVFDGGPTTVPLIEQGLFYYICGLSNYCSLGQKLVVAVTVHRASSPNSSATPIPPPPLPALQFSLPNPDRHDPQWDDPDIAGPPRAADTRSSGVGGDNGILGWAFFLIFGIFPPLLIFP